MSIDVSKLQAEVAALKDVADKAVGAIKNLQAQVAAIPPSNDPATQAAIDDLTAQVTSDVQELSDAVPVTPPTS